ncbi:MAG: CoA transferase [Dehalococcoidia bacterium]|nr:CoA transferase [Dehalococcoidia bacterium]
MSPGALAGVRVVDAATGWAALAGRLLADLGAAVVKLEPLAGEPGRTAPPLVAGESLPFWRRNLGKRVVRLAPEDPRLGALLASADVVIEGGPAQPFDLAPLVAERPDLIVAALRPFGAGPRAAWRATDLIAQAAGGMLALNGAPDREPLAVAGEPAYALAAHYLVGGVLLALRARRTVGVGQRVEVTLQEAVASAIEPVGALYNAEGRVVRRSGDLHWVRGYAIVPCADGDVAVAWNRNFPHLVALLASDGMADDLTDERYLDPAVIDAEIDHLRAVIGRWAATRTRAEIFHRAQELRLQWAPVNRPADVLADPQLAARRFFTWLPGPGGRLPVAGTPAQLSRTPWRPGRAATPASAVARQALPRQAPPPGARGALAGIRVLDFTWVLAGPYGTRILADHGAEVIKVQTDRKLVGYVGDGYFATWNRNKRSITLDLDSAEARALARRLVALCDVVADNFSARVMRQWGLDDETLLAIKPDLIIAHLTGMGRSGPYEHYVSYGPTAQALCGMSALTAYGPGERPLGLGFSLSDHIAGLVMANAILAALDHRDRTGEGQVIDVSQFEASASFLEEAYLEAAAGLPVDPRGNRGDRGSVGPVGLFRCAGDDRWLAVEVETSEQQAALARLLGVPVADLAAALAAWASEQDADAAMRLLQGIGVAASVVATAVDLVERDEGLRERGFWWMAAHPTLGLFRTDGSPIRLERTPPPAPRPSPLLGQHNSEVFVDLLGLAPEEVARLAAAGVIR